MKKKKNLDTMMTTAKRFHKRLSNSKTVASLPKHHQHSLPPYSPHQLITTITIGNSLRVLGKK